LESSGSRWILIVLAVLIYSVEAGIYERPWKGIREFNDAKDNVKKEIEGRNE